MVHVPVPTSETCARESLLVRVGVPTVHTPVVPVKFISNGTSAVATV